MSYKVFKAMYDFSQKSRELYPKVCNIAYNTVSPYKIKPFDLEVERGISLKKIKLENGEILGYREAGSGEKVLVLIHGNMNSSKNYDMLMEKIQNQYKIYAVDLRGFGISTYNQPIEKMKDFSEDVKQFIQALNIKKCSVMGWSAGGAVAMQLAVDYPELIEKLVLLCSASTYGYPFHKKDILSGKPNGEQVTTKDEVAKEVRYLLKAISFRNTWILKKFCDNFLYTVKKPPFMRYKAYLEEMIKQRNLVDLNYALITFNISHKHNGVVEGSGEVDHITMPTLVIHGKKDPVISREMSDYVVKEIGENASLAVLENSGHTPIVDELSSLIKVLNQFL
ncbi:alpha/beta hydrolase [Serpentinicella sp. ANB-PHB4]|uniref:intracellular short-chain-length polyhydroxyalkanoate depolymerase n=1 Tax=Serpentinicella sp. ANB-PHB4 TaxID=3074076 RepID=UPI002864EE1E|nr:alpha/beta hydrolase [Serpentinicella sp. ANB-PHB4]MDR5658662.1 alpha/beta hydrolase [Serpentinicella sp. ANB-PHB4]